MDDEKQGEYAFYYENGNLAAEGIFEKDLTNDHWTVYFENGKKKEKGTYFMGQKSGLWKFYDEKGKLSLKKEFEKPTTILQY